MTYSPDRRSLIAAADLALMLHHAAQSPPGAFVEVGVYRGGSARRLYELAERQGRTLYLFDTFAGHPESDGDPQHPRGQYADCADPAELQSEMPNARVAVGRFPESLAPLPPVAFVHADADLYQVTRDICDMLPPFMVPGGVLYFDDYPYPECTGVRRAVDEAFPERALLENGRAVVRVRGAVDVERLVREGMARSDVNPPDYVLRSDGTGEAP